MPIREILTKSMVFGVVSVACIIGGLVAFFGPHAYNDYVNGILGGLLILGGAGIAGVGGLMITLIVVAARKRQREARLRITPRPGPLGPPPPWGMGDVGRPDRASGGNHLATAMGGGGGGPRVMSTRLSNIDGPLFVAAMLVLTTGMLIWLSPR